MQLTSNDFRNNQPMPRELTCDGDNRNPHLAWSGAPPGTKSFALSCLDPDAPGRTFVHWLVCNIPATVTEFAAGIVPAGVTEHANDGGRTGYMGPCPPSGTHRYFFTVYALDVERLGGVTAQLFLEMIQAHTLATATCIGLYQRS